MVFKSGSIVALAEAVVWLNQHTKVWGFYSLNVTRISSQTTPNPTIHSM